MVITRGKGWGEVEEGKGGIVRERDLTLGGEHTYSTQMIYYKIVHMKHIILLITVNKFNHFFLFL